MPEPLLPTQLDALGSIFQHLPETVKQRLCEMLQARQFTKGQFIYLQDAEPQAIYIVSDGRVKINRDC